ncbi:MAG: SUMF1/EgtB/PvdO family nonheme iron enzyme [Candidatus Aminicenantes bacterium]|nr:SUMF1/EgtB/PvdO family nonheme iron enzyme [Candidatus Aminicenantes bacterium]
MKANWEKDSALQVVMEKIGVDYEILDYVGGGGLSRIYKVRQKFFGDFRALKIMDVDYLSQIFDKSGVKDKNKKFADIKGRFIKEAGIFEKISHPNIARMYDSGFVKDKKRQIEIPYLIMEFIDGLTLGDILNKDTPLDFERILGFSEDILPALHKIHEENIIHRDIKPANIMIDNNGKAILIDFGLAEDKPDGESSTTGAIMGTPAYIAPEIISRSKNPGPASDIYSFGVVLYEMVAGKKPFEGGHQLELIYDQLSFSVPNLTKINPKAPPGIREIVKKAMALNPNERYNSAEELLADLKKLKENLNNRGRKKLFKSLAASFIIAAVALFLIVNHLNRIGFLNKLPGDVKQVYKSTDIKPVQNNKKAWEADFGDGIVMVYIPPGKNLPGFWMGKTEVTVSRYMEFVDETRSNEPEWREKDSPFNIETGTDKYYENQVDNDFPVVGVSLENAAAYCRWLSEKTGLNFTLPSEAQWQMAARGTDGRDYPWKKDSRSAYTNLANFGFPGRKTTKVGSYPGGASFYGLLDMAGNVEEMCGNNAARGGSFLDRKEEFIKCTSRKELDSSKQRSNNLGFRLCMTFKR